MKRILALLLGASCASASAAPVRLAPAGQLRMPGLPGFGIDRSLATGGLAGLDAPGLPMSTLPALDAGLLVPEAPTFQGAREQLDAVARVRREAPAIPESAPAVSFFFNDHNASRSYRKELAAFVRSNEEILVEMLKPGEETRIFQEVSNGTLRPADALKLLRERNEPMDAEILRAIYGTGVRILPEPIHQAPYRAERARIDRDLVPLASERLSDAYYGFIEDGDAEGAFGSLKSFNETMVEVHRLREEALTASLLRRANRKRKRPVGVLFGMFHTQPYHELRRAGVDAAREFHPNARGPVRVTPYNRPLRRIRFGKPYEDPDAERRDTLGMLLFFSFLDPVYRIDRFAEGQTALYNRIAEKLSFEDYEELGEAMSEETFENHLDASWFALDWLAERGVIDKWERMAFRMDPATHKRLAAAGKKAFFRIARKWRLSEEETRSVLGVASSARLLKLRDDADAVLTEAELERVSYTLGIYKAIHTLFSTDDNVRRWLRADNKGFDGESALSRMMSGTKGIADVRAYLDAWVYGGGP
jgi:hypothetical protein